MSLEAIQKHELTRALNLPSRAKDLHRDLRSALVRASNTGQLLTSPAEIPRLVRLLPEPPPKVARDLEELKLHDGAYCIVGGEKNQERDRHIAHLVRDDEAWFDFSITVREHGKQLDLIAYDFEIRFLPGMGTPFLRFDLNLPDHRNETRELRSHLHPGSDDILAPAPLMSPLEILELFIDGLRRSEGRKPRAPTAFEVDWFQQTHASLRRDPSTTAP